ncbi:MAG: N-acetylmuramoyl-L-alanine amidase [Phycisphaerales bacterium]|jgi:N-acetylmuramoyl-L-alanine amidase|nr:N-acetylmuramoyl-L-alanine amidase [Phycisphaerales bacterium]MBT7171130.1 N-acetylmuramoyl-L-alanine amidase [Phycisphaerales bacterium]
MMHYSRISVCLVWCLIGVSLVGGMAGCEDPVADLPATPTSTGMTMIQLANLLSMTLSESDANRAVLVGGANRVVIRRTPLPRVFVNGQRVVAAGAISDRNGMLTVGFALSDAIRETLPKESAMTDPWVSISDKPTQPLVVLDPAHGGVDAGSVAPGLWMEKQVTLAIAMEAAKLLRTKQVDVLLTRNGDVYRSINTRGEWIRARQPALVVTLHTNMGTAGGAVYYPRRCDDDSPSYFLAANLAKRLGHTSAARVNDPAQHTYHGTLIEKVSPAAALIDLGSSRDEADATRLGSSQGKLAAAKAITDAIAAYLAADDNL